MRESEKPKKRYLASLIAVLLLLTSIIVAGACRNQPHKSAASPEKITIAAARLPYAGLLYVAADKRYFAQEGLDVTLVPFPHGKAAFEALLQRKADMAASMEAPVVMAAMKGTEIRILAAVFRSDRNHCIIALKGRGISYPADLDLKTVGVTRGTTREFFLYRFLEANGYTRDRLKIVEMMPGEMAQALQEGSVDAISTTDEQLPALKRMFGDRVLVFYNEAVYSAMHVLTTLPEFVAGNPQIVRKVLSALVKAEDFVKKNPEESRMIIAKAVNISPGDAEELWSSYSFKLSLDKALIVNMENLARWAIRSRLVDAKTIPNFLTVIQSTPLSEVKPQAVLMGG